MLRFSFRPLYAVNSAPVYLNIQICVLKFPQLQNSVVFSGRHPRQTNYKIQRFGDQLHLQHQGIPDGGDSVGLRNVGFHNLSDADVYPSTLLKKVLEAEIGSATSPCLENSPC